MNELPVSLGQLHNKLMEQLRDTVYPPGRRTQIALAYFSVVAEHHVAVAVLLDQKLFASAFALSRALYEAAVKGLWVSHCATEEKSETLARGKELDSVSDLLKSLTDANLPVVVRQSISDVKRRYWKALSSFTHAGHAQVSRWLSPDGVEPRYAEEEIRELVNFAAFFAVVAAHERARLGRNFQGMSRIATLLPLQVEADEA